MIFMEDLLIRTLKFLKMYDDYIASNIVNEQVLKDGTEKIENIKKLRDKIVLLVDRITDEKIDKQELINCLVNLHFYLAYSNLIIEDIHDLVNARRVHSYNEEESISA
jgi:hypothetical protein